jgi:hypothetical protein
LAWPLAKPLKTGQIVILLVHFSQIMTPGAPGWQLSGRAQPGLSCGFVRPGGVLVRAGENVRER